MSAAVQAGPGWIRPMQLESFAAQGLADLAGIFTESHGDAMKVIHWDCRQDVWKSKAFIMTLRSRCWCSAYGNHHHHDSYLAGALHSQGLIRLQQDFDRHVSDVAAWKGGSQGLARP